MTLDPQSGQAAGSAEPRTEPRAADLRGAELDEFLARAVERQITEQRALRETLTALTQAVNALSAPGTRLDPDDLADRVRASVRASIDPLIADIRTLGDDITQKVKGIASPAPQPSGAQAQELERLRDSVGGVSADIEGIAQALIDLNAGLREWAVGVDRSVTSIRESVESVRDIAVESYEVSELDETGAQPAIEEDEAEYEGGEIVQAEPVMPARLSGDPGELEQRIRESVELSLYLADQIEEFDRVLGGMGEIGSRIEGVVQQGMRRALAARSKLDTDANAALEETLSLLDSYVDKMSGTVEGFAQSEETLRKLGLGQVELASRLDSLYEAVHALAVGRDDRAATITKPAKPSAPRAKPKAKPKPKPTKKATAKRTTRKRSSKPARKDQPKDRAD